MTWSGYSEQGTGSQERGPGRFTVDVPGVPTQQGSPQFVPVRVGGDMRTSGALTVAPRVPQDNTLTELAKMGQELLAPKIAAEKDRQFLEGMSRAATGVAVQEIMAEQSKLSTLFGEAPAVEGARAYTVAAKKSAYVADVQNRMPELAKVSPDQLPAIIQQDVQAQLTGDPATDALLQRELLTAMPDLIRQHTKAAYVYQQGEAKKARRTAMSGSYAEYSATWNADPATRSADQMDKAEQRLLETWTPPPGVDEDSHMDDITDTLVTDLQAGNFDSARLAYDSGIITRLGPERAAKLEQAARRSAPAALKKVMPAMVDDLVDFAVNPPASTEEYVEKWNRINDKAAGMSRVPREYGEMLDPSALVRATQGATEAAQRGGRGTSAAAKAETEDTIVRAIASRAMQEDPRSGSTAVGFFRVNGVDIKAASVQRTLGKVFYEQGGPAEQARLLNSFSGEKIEAAHDYLQQMLESVSKPGAEWEKDGPAFQKLLQTWDSMSPAAQRQYFDERQRDQLSLWERKVKSGMPPEVLFSTSKAMERSDTTALRPEPDKGSVQDLIQRHLADVATDRTLGGLRGQRALDDDQTVLATFSEEEMARATAITLGLANRQGGRHVDPQRRAEYAFAEAIQTGQVDIMGGRLYLNEDPDDAIRNPLNVGVNRETAGLALDALITQGLKSQGVEGNDRTVIRVRGRPVKYIAAAVDKNGKEVYFTVTEDEVRSKVQERPAAAAPSDTPQQRAQQAGSRAAWTIGNQPVQRSN